MNPVIAIDGPSGSGKGTMAAMLAKRFNLAYLDTGLLYRAFACIYLFAYSNSSEKCININSIETLINYIDALLQIGIPKNASIKHIDIKFSENIIIKQTGKLIEKIKMIPITIIRSEAISMMASKMAKDYKLRSFITKLIKEFASTDEEKYNGIVIDGRDIGTSIFPQADCKIYMTADLRMRALRRLRSVKEKNPQITFEEVYENLKKRDEFDASHLIDPLSFDKNYIIINTSNDSIETTFLSLIKVVENKFNF